MYLIRLPFGLLELFTVLLFTYGFKENISTRATIINTRKTI